MVGFESQIRTGDITADIGGRVFKAEIAGTADIGIEFTRQVNLGIFAVHCNIARG
mgnify:CR=1 FL=1